MEAQERLVFEGFSTSGGRGCSINHLRAAVRLRAADTFDRLITLLEILVIRDV